MYTSLLREISQGSRRSFRGGILVPSVSDIHHWPVFSSCGRPSWTQRRPGRLSHSNTVLIVRCNYLLGTLNTGDHTQWYVCNWGQIISSLYRGKLFFRGTTIRGLPTYTHSNTHLVIGGPIVMLCIMNIGH